MLSKYIAVPRISVDRMLRLVMINTKSKCNGQYRDHIVRQLTRGYPDQDQEDLEVGASYHHLHRSEISKEVWESIVGSGSFWEGWRFPRSGGGSFIPPPPPF